MKVVVPPPRPGLESIFEFMNSVVSTKPQALQVQIADQMRDCKAAGKRILWVGGPSDRCTRVDHRHCRALVEAGYVDVLFGEMPWRPTTSRRTCTARRWVST